MSHDEIMAELAKCGEMSRQIDANLKEIIRLRKEYEAQENILCPPNPRLNCNQIQHSRQSQEASQSPR